MGLFGGKAYKFRFYTTGETAYTEEIFTNIKKILDEHMKGLYDLETINILFKQKVAKEDGVFKTPALAKVLPLPKQKITGNIADPDQLRQGLTSLLEKKTETPPPPPTPPA